LKKKYKVLVLLANYNSSKYIINQLKSIQLQRNCDITVNIVDDCSSDDGVEKIKKFKSINKNFKIRLLINNTNVGYAINFYNLITLADSKNFDYIAYSDHDDYFYASKFYSSINALIQKKCDAISTPVVCFGQKNRVLSQSPNQTKYDFLFEGAGQGCTFVMRAKPFEEFKNFSKKNHKIIQHFYFHDWLTYIFFRAKGYKWLFHNNALTKYRIHNTNLVGNKFSIKGIQYRLSKLFNGWYYYQVLLASEIAYRIDSNIISIKHTNSLNLIITLFFHSRRKYSERFISAISIIFCKIFKN
jgi:rhamnosyltransferase